ncbi:MAG: MarR family transcriptional regulator [Armatimonadetes bacterium]|nr:MarR family transcriptional regulator [Armatimonadota bacterium]
MNDFDEASAPDCLGHTGAEMHFLRELVRAAQTLIAAFSREVGMTGARLAVLRALAVSASTPLGTMEIARRLAVNAAAVTRQLQAMEADGLVERVSDGRDGRRSAAVLTVAGREAFALVHERGHAFEERLAALVGADDMAVATSVLTRAREALETAR